MVAMFLSKEERSKRLQMASDRLGGDAELGRKLGYKDGSFVGQMIRGEKSITEKTIQKLVKITEVRDLFTFDANAGFTLPANDESPQTDPPAVTPMDVSATGLEIGRLYDLIPASDIVRRSKAYRDAVTAILAVVEDEQPKGHRSPGSES